MKQSKTLQQLQDDLKEFDKKYWVAPEGKVGGTTHITLHLAKLLGKIGEVTERWDHGFNPDEDKIKEEVIPDLLIYAMQLAYLWDVDLESAYFKRQEHNKKRVESWEPGGSNNK